MQSLILHRKLAEQSRAGNITRVHRICQRLRSQAPNIDEQTQSGSAWSMEARYALSSCAFHFPQPAPRKQIHTLASAVNYTVFNIFNRAHESFEPLIRFETGKRLRGWDISLASARKRVSKSKSRGFGNNRAFFSTRSSAALLIVPN